MGPIAEKTVAVRLVAMTSQYRTAMAGATAQTAGFAKTAQSARAGVVTSFGGKAGIAGAAVLAGGAVAKLALDYDNAFTKIGAITNTSQAQVAQWREQTLKLAGETAQAPQELAEGLYFLASAGLDTADVFPTLEASAKGAAVGLGEMGDISRLTANVLNAFPDSGMKAVDVIDTLVAAVREGTAEPEEFADAMGRILPIAAKAGISFDQVAASLAGLSNIGLDVNEGVTAMRGVLNATVAPGKQAADALASVGLSAEDLRRSLAEDGLIATLRLLEQRTGGNMDLMRKIVPNIRAMTGAFGLTGQEAEKVDAIFRNVADATGSLDKAFRTTEQSAGFQLRAAFAELTALGIELGDEVLPLIVDTMQLLVPIASDVAETVGDIIGPIVQVIEKAQQLRGSFGEVREESGLLGEAFRAGERGLRQMFPTMFALIDANKAGADSTEAWNLSQEQANAGIEASIPLIEDAARQLGFLPPAEEEAADGATHVERALRGANREMKRGAGAADQLAQELGILAGVELEAEAAAIEWEQALDDAFKELKEGTRTLDITNQAGRDNRQALLDAAEAAIDHGVAVAKETGSLEKGQRAVRNHIQALIDQATQAGFSEEAVRDYLRQLNLTPKQINTIIRAHVADARAKLQGFIGDLDQVPDIKDVLIRVRSTGPGTGQQIGHAGGTVGALHAQRMHGGGELRGDEAWFVGQRGERVLSLGQMQTLRSILGMPRAQAEAAAAPVIRPTFIVKVGERQVTDIVVQALNAAGRR